VLHHLQAIPVATKNTRNAADPDTDRWWLIYVALVAGGLLSWCCGVNLFEELPIPPMVGLVLTALIVGGGAPMIHGLVNKARDPLAVLRGRSGAL